MGVETKDALEIRDGLKVNGLLTIGNGNLKLSGITANASATVTISNVAPAAVGTATISAWLEIDVAGTKYYIPCWT